MVWVAQDQQGAVAHRLGCFNRVGDEAAAEALAVQPRRNKHRAKADGWKNNRITLFYARFAVINAPFDLPVHLNHKAERRYKVGVAAHFVQHKMLLRAREIKVPKGLARKGFTAMILLLALRPDLNVHQKASKSAKNAALK